MKNLTEKELSEIYDEQQLPGLIEMYGVKGEQFTDTIMINEDFNNWTDMLCKDGTISDEQYNEFCYVGKYSD